jgi:N4-gp56 family major capsid protein
MAAPFTWTFDAPSGTYKNHALSKKLYMKALENSKFMDFVRGVEGFGRKKGETITLTRVSTIAEPASAVLTETSRIPEDVFALSTISITVQELGRAVPYTSLSEDLSEFDIENPIQRRLTDQKTLVLDTLAATAFKSTLVKYAPTGAASATITTNGTPAAASSNLNVFHCEEIRDYMFATLLAPPWQGNDYMCIAATKAIRGVRRDPSWEQWQVYTNPEAKANFELGRLENLRFIETNHTNALSNAKGSNSIGEAVVFGEDAVVMAEAISPELRAAQPADFGRAKSVAWYGVLAFGLVWDTANAGECRVLHVTSA